MIVMPNDLGLPAGCRGTDRNAGIWHRFDDDMDNIRRMDKVLLIVENDAGFAQFLLEMAHECGFKGIISSRGADALAIVRQRKLDAITLDINLHDLDGWRVLARLKDDTLTRHIPVHIITTEEERERGLRLGAIGALIKPLKSKETLKEVFARIQSVIQRADQEPAGGRQGRSAAGNEVIELVGGEGIEATRRGSSGQDALAKLRDNYFGAAVLSLDMEDMTGFELVEEIKKDPHLGDDADHRLCGTRNLSKKDEAHLKRLCQTMTLKEVRARRSVCWMRRRCSCHCDINARCRKTSGWPSRNCIRPKPC